jgi:diaminopimelate epimerase
MARRGSAKLDFARAVEPLIHAELDRAHRACAARLRGRAVAAAAPPLRLDRLARPFDRERFAGPAAFRRRLLGVLRDDVAESRLGTRGSPLKARSRCWARPLPGPSARVPAGMAGFPFAKWQGLGNHYLLVEREAWPLPLTAARARRLCDPHFGVGGDGVLELDFEAGGPRMTVWNPDGSQAESCGNGIRMVARYLDGRGLLRDDQPIQTGGGPVAARILDDGRVEVRMGRARFPAGERRERLSVEGGAVELAEVSMGNPHAVIVHPDPDAVVRRLGPAVETAARFPERTNVEFIRAEGPSELTMRVWERGVGETMACGTGACAAAVAAVRLGGAASPVTVHLPGGDLVIAVDDDLEVTMTGPAEPLYDGWLSNELADALETA